MNCQVRKEIRFCRRTFSSIKLIKIWLCILLNKIVQTIGWMMLIHWSRFIVQPCKAHNCSFFFFFFFSSSWTSIYTDDNYCHSKVPITASMVTQFTRTPGLWHSYYCLVQVVNWWLLKWHWILALLLSPCSFPVYKWCTLVTQLKCYRTFT